MAINIYLTFNGNCREAVDFYSNVFGTEKQKIMTFGESPQPQSNIPDEAKDKIMHTFLSIGGSVVMMSDIFPGMPFSTGNNISLTVMYQDADAVKSVFNKLKEGGKVNMGLQQTFFSNYFGMLTDRFGIEWQIGVESSH